MAAIASSLSDEQLHQALKRCRPEVIKAAQSYRISRDIALLPLIVSGVIERFVEPDRRPFLRASDDTVRLTEDLGVDSLTMMEIVLLAEDIFQITITSEDLRSLCTLGQIKTFIACKIKGHRLPACEDF